MLKIPAWYIPTKTVDYEAEVFQFLKASATFGHLALPPPFSCYFTLLELITSKFFLDPVECTGQDVAKALVILLHNRKSLPMIQDELSGGSKLEKAAAKLWKKHGKSITENYEKIVNWVLVIPCEGFDLLPTGKKSNKPFWFDAEYLAMNAMIATQASGMTMDAVLWDMSFETFGHLIAADAKREGVSGVERKANKEVLKKELEAAREREAKGQLHPWQIKYPERYEPSKEQVDARLDILKEWEELKNADKH